MSRQEEAQAKGKMTWNGCWDCQKKGNSMALGYFAAVSRVEIKELRDKLCDVQAAMDRNKRTAAQEIRVLDAKLSRWIAETTRRLEALEGKVGGGVEWSDQEIFSRFHAYVVKSCHPALAVEKTAGCLNMSLADVGAAIRRHAGI